VLAGLVDLELDDLPIARSLEEDGSPRRDRHLVTLPPGRGWPGRVIPFRLGAAATPVKPTGFSLSRYVSFVNT
jgi:hypothetical protein